MTTPVYLGLGSNLGDRSASLRAALASMEAHPATAAVRVSPFYETAPLGDCDQPMYLNAVAQVETSLAPAALLTVLQEIEQQLGRTRGKRWQPRTIDLDVLLYGEQIIALPDLTIPHPQMHLRSFVLKGLCEVNPGARHPVLRRTAEQLYERLNGRDFVRNYSRPQVISVAGLIGVGKTTLAARLAETLAARLICEKYDDNPYLADVYAGNKNVALDSELFFLSSSATQLRRDRLKAGCRYVSDYVFDKALIYASSWLSPDDLARYRKHYDCVAEQVAAPTLAIYLDDAVEQCLDRIHQRNRPYEQRIEPDFLIGLKEKYDALYADWTRCPLIRMTAAECIREFQTVVWADEIRHYIA